LGKNIVKQVRLLFRRRDKKNKYSLGVGIYDLDNNLISKFKNNVELAKHLNISKVTVGKYLNSSLVYNKTYYFKPIQD